MNTVSHSQPELTPEQVPVLIAGGVYLLHRKDAHAFFTR